MTEKEPDHRPRFATWDDDFGTAQSRAVEPVLIDTIEVGERYRTPSQEAIDLMARSIEEVGLQTPICILGVPYREADGEVAGIESWQLIAGATRLAAAKRLGWDEIDAFIILEGNEADSKLREIAENLHRTELTALERDQQIAEWTKLCDEKAKGGQVAHPGGQQPQNAGVSQAARDLGVDRRSVRRAIAVDTLSDEAKETARKVGLDDNQSALLGAAKEETPEDQVRFLEGKIAEREQRGVKAPPPVPPPATKSADAISSYDRLLAVWRSSTQADRDRLLAEEINQEKVSATTRSSTEPTKPSQGELSEFSASPSAGPNGPPNHILSAPVADAGEIPEFLKR